MKKIIRMLVFSAAALYLTSIWNKGFSIHYDVAVFVKAVVLIGLIYYLITPLLKILLLPLNFITFGLASIIAYVALFYFIITKFSIVDIKPWTFTGFQLYWIRIPKTEFNYWMNMAISSFSVSTVINLLEGLL